MIGNLCTTVSRGVLSLILGLVAPVILTTSVNAGPHCHCRTTNSELVEVGNYTCIKTNEGLREARCEFVLNNTAWKLTGKFCPIGFNKLNPKDRRINIARIDFNKIR